MGRPYVFPAPENRSPADNSTFVTRAKVIGLFNAATNSDQNNVTERVQIWFEQEAKRLGWSSVIFSSDGAMLTAEVLVNRKERANDTGNVVSIKRTRRV